MSLKKKGKFEEFYFVVVNVKLQIEYECWSWTSPAMDAAPIMFSYIK